MQETGTHTSSIAPEKEPRDSLLLWLFAAAARLQAYAAP
jgi:hypothetical protein